MQVMNVQGLGTRLMAGHVCAFQCMLSLVVLASFSDNCFFSENTGEGQRQNHVPSRRRQLSGKPNWLSCVIIFKSNWEVHTSNQLPFCHKTGGLGTGHTEYNNMYQLYCKLCPNHNTHENLLKMVPHCVSLNVWLSIMIQACFHRDMIWCTLSKPQVILQRKKEYVVKALLAIYIKHKYIQFVHSVHCPVLSILVLISLPSWSCR